MDDNPTKLYEVVANVLEKSKFIDIFYEHESRSIIPDDQYWKMNVLIIPWKATKGGSL